MDAMGVRLDLHMNGDYLTPMAQTVRAAASATIAGGVALVCGFKYLASEKSREPIGGDAAQALATRPDSAVAIKIGTTDMDNAIAIDNNHLTMNDTARTLSGDHESRVTDTGTSIVQSAGAVRTANTHANGHGVVEEVTHTLDRASGQAVAVGNPWDTQSQQVLMSTNGVVPPLAANGKTERRHEGADRRAVVIGCDRRNQSGSDEVQPALQSTVSDGGSTVAVGFKAGQSANGGLGVEEEVCPTQSHQPSALEPTVAIGCDRTPAVIQQINTILENNHANAAETNPGEVLRVLRSAIGEKAFEGWAARVAASLHSAQILQQGLLQLVLRASAQAGCEMDDGSLPCEEDGSAGAVRDLREAERDGRPPQGRELPQQRAGESDSPVPQLPHQDASQAEGVQDLWRTDEGAWILRQALSALQEIRRSARVEKKPAYANLTHIVRRLTPVEAERLQGFPDGWSRIPYRGKPADECPDSPRYKALGNSFATNCCEYVLRRIVAAFRLDMIP